MKTLLSIVALLVLQACAVLGNSPEAQINQGAQTHTAATTLATTLLERRKITLAQAQSYRGMLGSASTALDSSAKTLAACRTMTGSNIAMRPDPCAQTVTSDVNLALSVLLEIEKRLQVEAAKTGEAK